MSSPENLDLVRLTRQQTKVLMGRNYLTAKGPQDAPTGNTNAQKQSPQNEDFESEDEGSGKTGEQVAKDYGVGQATLRKRTEMMGGSRSSEILPGRIFPGLVAEKLHRCKNWRALANFPRGQLRSHAVEAADTAEARRRLRACLARVRVGIV